MTRNAKPPSDGAARFTLALLTCGILLNASGCTDRADDCHLRKDCPPSQTSSPIAAGGGGASGGVGGFGTGGTSAASEDGCKLGCAGATPHCLEANRCVVCIDNAQCAGARAICAPLTHACVECVVNTDCRESSKPVCNTATNTCVACAKNLDCKDAQAPRCNLNTGTCEACATNLDCEHIPQKAVCDSQACVACTPENEAACQSGAVEYTCDPATRACTHTQKGSRGTCQSCVADTDCGTTDGVPDPNSHCISMSFQGVALGKYCLKTLSSVATCSAPYVVELETVSASRKQPAVYCSIDQWTTTCDALLDFFAATPCTTDSECGAGKGGLCRQVGMGASPPPVCTIPCASNDHCTEGKYCSGTIGGFCK